MLKVYMVEGGGEVVEGYEIQRNHMQPWEAPQLNIMGGWENI